MTDDEDIPQESSPVGGAEMTVTNGLQVGCVALILATTGAI